MIRRLNNSIFFSLIGSPFLLGSKKYLLNSSLLSGKHLFALNVIDASSVLIFSSNKIARIISINSESLIFPLSSNSSPE